MYSGMVPFLPFLFFLIWLALICYAILLATRLVNAVEQISRLLEQRLPNSTRQ